MASFNVTIFNKTSLQVTGTDRQADIWIDLGIGRHAPPKIMSGSEIKNHLQLYPIHCPSVPVSQCHSVPVSWYPNVLVSQCPIVLVSRCPIVPLSHCRLVPLSWCPSVPVTRGGQRNTQGWSGNRLTHIFCYKHTHIQRFI